MHEVMQPTPGRSWVLTHEGYDVLTENAVESRFALGNGFLASALCDMRALGEAALADWRDAAGRIVTGLDPATGLHEQHAGYHELEPLDLSLYSDRKVPIDVLIGRERTQRSQVVKQADVVALLVLLPDEFRGAAATANFRYYEPRYAHGSSLSAGIHALVAARLGETATALRYLHQAAAADLELDPNSAGGIRISGLGGLWQAIVLGLGGIDLTGEMPRIEPRLPPHGHTLSLRIRWRGRTLEVRIAAPSVDVRLRSGEEIGIEIAGAIHRLAPDATVQVLL
jgi:trehalose/maltose hydrolase-like predicted phosphorylase